MQISELPFVLVIITMVLSVVLKIIGDWSLYVVHRAFTRMSVFWAVSRVGESEDQGILPDSNVLLGKV